MIKNYLFRYRKLHVCRKNSLLHKFFTRPKRLHHYVIGGLCKNEVISNKTIIKHYIYV